VRCLEFRRARFVRGSEWAQHSASPSCGKRAPDWIRKMGW
jgi:hypothetical protein